MSTTAAIQESAGSPAQGPDTDGPEKKELWFVPPFNAGDLDGLMAHFELDTVFVTAAGTVVAGLDGVREVFREALWNKLTVAGTTTRIVRAGEVALLYFDWTLTALGSLEAAEGTAVVVMRRRDDGKWLVAIKDPFSLMTR